MEPIVSGVGVLDKSMAIISALRREPMQLQELVGATGFSRATAHRLAVALESHGLVRRTVSGQFALGVDLIALGRSAGEQYPITEAAEGPMSRLRDATGESVQLYVMDGENRVCIAALESPHGLRTIVAVGEMLPVDKGSAGRVLRGASSADRHGDGQDGHLTKGDTWVASAGEREPGVASVSAPVHDLDDSTVIAAVSVSGPIDRMGMSPGDSHGAVVAKAAREIEVALRR